MKVLLVSPQMEKSNGEIATWTNIYLAHCSENNIEPTVLNTATVGARAKNGRI